MASQETFSMFLFNNRPHQNQHKLQKYPPLAGMAPSMKDDPSPSLPVENIRQTRSKDLGRGPLKVSKFLINNFSNTGMRRSPVSSKKTRHVRLITVGASHYCEKIRWALDLLEASPTSPTFYTEDAHPPAFAAISTVPASGGEASRSPMIVMDSLLPDVSQTVVYDSSDILQAIYPGLYPAKFHDEIVNFEKEMGKKLGPTVRVLVYHEILQPEFHSLASDICGYHTSFVEDQLFRRLLPRGLAKGMRKLMDINNDTSRLSLTAVKEVFSEVSNRLEGGKKQYLFGHDSITAADLAFAALSYPLLRPVEMGAMLGGSKYPDTAWPQRLNDIRDELRATPAGQHVLKMYSLHRFGVGQAPKRNTTKLLVSPKSIGRNRIPPTLTFGAVAAAASALAVGMNNLNSRL